MESKTEFVKMTLYRVLMENDTLIMDVDPYDRLEHHGEFFPWGRCFEHVVDRDRWADVTWTYYEFTEWARVDVSKIFAVKEIKDADVRAGTLPEESSRNRPNQTLADLKGILSTTGREFDDGHL